MKRLILLSLLVSTSMELYASAGGSPEIASEKLLKDYFAINKKKRTTPKYAELDDMSNAQIQAEIDRLSALPDVESSPIAETQAYVSLSEEQLASYLTHLNSFQIRYSNAWSKYKHDQNQPGTQLQAVAKVLLTELQQLAADIRGILEKNIMFSEQSVSLQELSRLLAAIEEKDIQWLEELTHSPAAEKPATTPAAERPVATPDTPASSISYQIRWLGQDSLETIALPDKQEYSILEIKNALYVAQGIPGIQQKISFKGKVLNDNDRITKENLQTGEIEFSWIQKPSVATPTAGAPLPIGTGRTGEHTATTSKEEYDRAMAAAIARSLGKTEPASPSGKAAGDAPKSAVRPTAGAPDAAVVERERILRDYFAMNTRKGNHPKPEETLRGMSNAAIQAEILRISKFSDATPAPDLGRVMPPMVGAPDTAVAERERIITDYLAMNTRKGNTPKPAEVLRGMSNEAIQAEILRISKFSDATPAPDLGRVMPPMVAAPRVDMPALPGLIPYNNRLTNNYEDRMFHWPIDRFSSGGMQQLMTNYGMQDALVVMDMDGTLIEQLGARGMPDPLDEVKKELNALKYARDDADERAARVALRRAITEKGIRLPGRILNPETRNYMMAQKQANNPVIIVTSRDEELREITVQQLTEAGFNQGEHYDQLIMTGNLPKPAFMTQILVDSGKTNIVFVDDNIGNVLPVAKFFSSYQYNAGTRRFTLTDRSPYRTLVIHCGYDGEFTDREERARGHQTYDILLDNMRRRGQI